MHWQAAALDELAHNPAYRIAPRDGDAATAAAAAAAPPSTAVPPPAYLGEFASPYDISVLGVWGSSSSSSSSDNASALLTPGLLAMLLAGLADAGAYELFRAVGSRVEAASAAAVTPAAGIGAHMLAATAEQAAAASPADGAPTMVAIRGAADARRAQAAAASALLRSAPPHPTFHVALWDPADVACVLRAFTAAGVAHPGLFGAVAAYVPAGAWLPQEARTAWHAAATAAASRASGAAEAGPPASAAPDAAPPPPGILAPEAVDVLHAFALTGAIHAHCSWAGRVLTSLYRCPTEPLVALLAQEKRLDDLFKVGMGMGVGWGGCEVPRCATALSLSALLGRPR